MIIDIDECWWCWWWLLECWWQMIKHGLETWLMLMLHSSWWSIVDYRGWTPVLSFSCSGNQRTATSVDRSLRYLGSHEQRRISHLGLGSKLCIDHSISWCLVSHCHLLVVSILLVDLASRSCRDDARARGGGRYKHDIIPDLEKHLEDAHMLWHSRWHRICLLIHPPIEQQQLASLMGTPSDHEGFMCV